MIRRVHRSPPHPFFVAALIDLHQSAAAQAD
jgi:hypothetical protein